MEKIVFHEEDTNEMINTIYEHFITTQFILNYMKYQVQDQKHYNLEIRYFVFFFLY